MQSGMHCAGVMHQGYCGRVLAVRLSVEASSYAMSTTVFAAPCGLMPLARLCETASTT